MSIGSVGSGDGAGSWRFLRARRSHQRPKAAAIVAVVSAIGCSIGIARDDAGAAPSTRTFLFSTKIPSTTTTRYGGRLIRAHAPRSVTDEMDNELLDLTDG